MASSSSSSSASSAAAAASSTTTNTKTNKPVVCLVIGMAGSGKTTLMQRLNAVTHERGTPSYIINMDPAVDKLPYSPNIDIRDTVKYKEVMKQYTLGPNGAILTSLNLFATRFDQVMGFVKKRSETLKYVFVDTPGQIEIFSWSASGTIITEALANEFPTIILYVVDTPRSHSPVTFMSNMSYACSIMYKTKLPLMVVFNKTDVVKADFATKWMSDIDEFTTALQSEDSYMSTLTRSMSLVLDEFYSQLKSVGVSAITGDGMDEFFKRVAESKQEYDDVYRPHLDKLIAEQRERDELRKKEQMARLERDMKNSTSNKDDKTEAVMAQYDDDAEARAELEAYKSTLAAMDNE